MCASAFDDRADADSGNASDGLAVMPGGAEISSFVRIGADVELQTRGSAPSTLRRDAVSLGAILKSIRVPVTVSGHPRTLAKEIHAF